MQDRTVDYHEYLKKTGKDTSAKAYLWALNRFKTYLLENTEHDITSFNYQDAEVYMRNSFESPRTANNFKIALTGYLRFITTSMTTDDPAYDAMVKKFEQMRFLKNLKVGRRREKASLGIEELRTFLNAINVRFKGNEVYSLALLFAYFGVRPIELENNISDAKINWKDNSMIIVGAKTGYERYLCWPSKLTPHVKKVIDRAPFPYSGEWFTKKLKWAQNNDESMTIDGIFVTAKAFRKTFQTQERMLGVSDLLINEVMGHANSTDRMADVYTDPTNPEFVEKIREFMLGDKHYMIKYGII